MSKKTKKVNKEINKEVKTMANEAKAIEQEVKAEEQVAPDQEETMIHIFGPFYRTKKVKPEEEKESLLKKVGKPVALVGAGIGVGFGICKAIAGIEDDGEADDTEE